MGGMDPLGDIMGTSAGPKRGKSKILTVKEINIIQNNHWYFFNSIKTKENESLTIFSSIMGTLCFTHEIMDEKNSLAV